MSKTRNITEPRWLIWAREMQALAQTGLAFIQDQYDHERYQRLQSLAAEVMVEHTGAAVPDIEVMFTRQTGYATPKLGVRGAVSRTKKCCSFVKWKMGIAGRCRVDGLT